MSTSLIYDDRFINHATGESPESPERYIQIIETLQADTQLWNKLIKKAPQAATLSDIERCHSKELIRIVSQFCAEGGGHLDQDTVLSPESYDIALLSAGAAITAVEEVFSGKSNTAFSLARPPGHHATYDKAMGFCIFNNAAIAARYAQVKHQVENVLIIDWDVHHGNGTQDIFYQDPSVFYFSIHQYPFYPGTGAYSEIGEGKGKGKNLNIPLPAGTPAHLHREAFSAGLKTIKKLFTPDFIIISAGFDARLGDPLGHLQLLGKDYIEMTNEVMEMAAQTSTNKVISVLEGGYVNNGSLGEVVRDHVGAMAMSS